jgi:hypothetical protein
MLVVGRGHIYWISFVHEIVELRDGKRCRRLGQKSVRGARQLIQISTAPPIANINRNGTINLRT